MLQVARASPGDTWGWEVRPSVATRACTRVFGGWPRGLEAISFARRGRQLGRDRRPRRADAQVATSGSAGSDARDGKTLYDGVSAGAGGAGESISRAGPVM